MKLKQYLNKGKRKVPTFVRFGGLSKRNQIKYGISQNFHKAPVNKGIYAFIWPYIENYLFAWKMKSLDYPLEAEKWTIDKWK